MESNDNKSSANKHSIKCNQQETFEVRTYILEVENGVVDMKYIMLCKKAMNSNGYELLEHSIHKMVYDLPSYMLMF